MAVTMNPLTSGTVGSSSGNTASISPGANQLILVAVVGGVSSTTGISLSGNSLTWETILSLSITGPRVLHLVRSLGASPSSGALTITHTDTGISNMSWSVAEFDGVDTTGSNGSGAIVQSVSSSTGSSVHTFTITLAAFGDANNATYGMFGMRGYKPGT